MENSFLNWVLENHVLEILCVLQAIMICFFALTLNHPRQLVKMGWVGKFVAFVWYSKRARDYKRDSE